MLFRYLKWNKLNEINNLPLTQVKTQPGTFIQVYIENYQGVKWEVELFLNSNQ